MKIRVGVFFGGESVEHEISILSAHQALKAIDTDKYEIIPVYVSKQRKMYTGEALLDLDNFKDLKAIEKKSRQVTLVKNANNAYQLLPIDKKLFDKELLIDLAFPIMHGTNGEDGSLQGFFEMANIPYVGCDVVAAAVGQDKVVMKHILENSKLPITKWFWLYAHELDANIDKYKALAKEIGYPLIVKPACLGSSVGIGIAHDEEELISVIKEAGKFDNKICVEKIISNLRELNCSVLGTPFKAMASDIEEVTKKDEILSYQDKYLGGSKSSKTQTASKGMASASRQVPANIGDELTNKIKKLSLDTFRVLGSSGVCRIDFLLDDSTNEVYVNEINTIPGSLAFYLWQSTGMDFTELTNNLLNQAVERQRRREKMIYSYDTNILKDMKKSGTKGSKQ